VHGTADGAPGLAVDRFTDVAIIHADSSHVLEEWLPAVQSEVGALCPTGYVKVHPRGVSRVTDLARFAPAAPAWGPRRDEVIAFEHGIQFTVRPGVGLSVGLFLDMREIRGWLHEHSNEKSVLNLFAYTCSFGVSASLGGARRVVNLDVSRPYLEWGKANYALNGLEVDDRDFIFGDAFDWLTRFARRGQSFDIVVVDPPSFSSTPFSVTRDYVRLAEAAARVVTDGGVLLAATNHTGTTPERFETWLFEGLERSGRTGRMTRRWHEPPEDFPIPNGGRPYLKVMALSLD
jgi:23S rRNA (cytosine1962-C5)-methyltransferase